MIDGEKLRTLRENSGMTQQDLADKMGVTVQAVSQWEHGRTQPDISRVRELATTLGTTTDALLSTDPSDAYWQLRGQLFSVDHTFARMKAAAESESLPETRRALQYAREQHEGQTRDTARGSSRTVPYLQHPLMMAAYAHALGVRDDEVLAAALLHDVCEECGVRPEDLPFSENVREAVALLTKDPEAFAEDPQRAEDEYFGAIRGNCTAMLVKCLDRHDNLGTANACFTPKRLRKYIVETEEHILPLVDELSAQCMQFADQAFILKYELLTLVESTKAMITFAGQED